LSKKQIETSNNCVPTADEDWWIPWTMDQRNQFMRRGVPFPSSPPGNIS
jgi:hypothetical protein